MSRRPLMALVVANTASLLGNVVAAVAIPWFVLVTTGSVARTGVAAFATTLPLAFGAFFGGAVADRVGHRRAAVASDVASAFAFGAIPALHALGHLGFASLLALAFVGSLFDAPGQAAREALLPDAADRARVGRDRASALWTTTEHTGYVLGAPLAGLLIAVAGAPAALWVDAASFVVSAAVVLAGVPPARAAAAMEPYRRRLVEGLRFIAGNRTIVWFFVLATCGNFLIAPLAPIFVPVYAREELGGAGSLGLLLGAYGAGGLVGAAGYGIVAGRVSRRAVFLTVWLAYAPLCAVLVTLPPLVVAAPALFGIGVLAGTTGPLEQLVRQEHTPPELRGRVFSTFIASLTAVVPPALLGAGLLVDALGLRAGFIVFTVGNALLTALAVRVALPRLGPPATTPRPARAGVRRASSTSRS